jgi:hypothetical protein
VVNGFSLQRAWRESNIGSVCLLKEMRRFIQTAIAEEICTTQMELYFVYSALLLTKTYRALVKSSALQQGGRSHWAILDSPLETLSVLSKAA